MLFRGETNTYTFNCIRPILFSIHLLRMISFSQMYNVPFNPAQTELDIHRNICIQNSVYSDIFFIKIYNTYCVWKKCHGIFQICPISCCTRLPGLGWQLWLLRYEKLKCQWTHLCCPEGWSSDCWWRGRPRRSRTCGHWAARPCPPHWWSGWPEEIHTSHQSVKVLPKSS